MSSKTERKILRVVEANVAPSSKALRRRRARQRKKLLGGKGGKLIGRLEREADLVDAAFVRGNTPTLGRRSLKKARKSGTVVRNGREYIIGKNNKADPRNLVASLGATPGGCAWALKALHPCGEDSPAYNSGVPDRATNDSCVPQGRLNASIGRPQVLAIPDRILKPSAEGQTPATAPSPWHGDVSWNVELLSVPGAYSYLILQASPDGIFVDHGFQVSNADITSDILDGKWYPIAYDDSIKGVKGTGTSDVPPDSLPAGYWNAICSFSLPLFGSNLDEKNLAKLMQGFRTTYNGLTIELDVATLKDQGRIYAGSIKPDFRHVDYGRPEIAGEETVNLAVPITTTDLTQLVRNVYYEPAKKGVYMPLKISEPVLKYIDTDISAPAFVINDSIAKVGGGTQFPYVRYDTVDENFNVSVCFLMNLADTAYLDLKHRAGFQCAVAPGSPWRPFSQPPPRYDSLALDNVATLMASMPDAYEAKYNDLGKILDTIGGLIEGLGIPIISDIAHIARPIVGGLAGLINI